METAPQEKPTNNIVLNIRVFEMKECNIPFGLNYVTPSKMIITITFGP